MPKILITGNGFDLFHNLPTKYQHFMSIMKTIETNNFTGKVSFEDLFGNDFKCDSPYDYKAIKDEFNIDKFLFDGEKLNEINELLQSNPWYKYFCDVLRLETWIDFELEIAAVLDQMAIFKKCNNNIHFSKNRFKDDSISYSSLEVFSIFNIVEIINRRGAFRFNAGYLNMRTTSVDIKKIYNDLTQTFEDFVDIFNYYLVNVVKVFYQQAIFKKEIPFDLIDLIYTFNYTPTMEFFYNIDKSKINYIHGRIDEDCNKHTLVVGVHDVPDDAKMVKYHSFGKYYQKAVKNLNFSIFESLKYKGGNQTIFYIIGHSLNESDKNYVINLFDFLKSENNKTAKICIFYFNDADKANKFNNLFSIIEREIIDKLLEAQRLYFVELSNVNIKKEFTITLQRSGGWG
jgi:hypothetical protein